MSSDVAMQDAAAAEEERIQYGHGPLVEQELKERYPNRPHNRHKTLPFRDLYLTLFNPLNENRKRPAGPRKKVGPHGPNQLSSSEQKRYVIERFISRWKKEVGNDFYPALRLIIPEKDRDRSIYGLKEKTIGKLLVKVMQIDKNSEDGFNLLNWKLPGQRAKSAMTGDFAGRCFEVISKRPLRTTPGDLSIGEVNGMLDRLASAQRENDQVKLFQEFYKAMNAEEMMWLIRMILRQMKIGATERTLFGLWHPDADSLFNVSSSLRRVCWELYDRSVRLHEQDRGICLMQCFQPQLAAFQMHSLDRMLERFRPTEGDDEFWIEEKLDGERMQLHMIEDESVRGGRRFAFWSRKGKDYTYLYGNSFHDDSAALTRHIQKAFGSRVRNIILDGEMITWDPVENAIVPFGTLKTAALSEQRNPFTTGHRPVFRVFDCLYLNDQPLTQYTLRDRRRALESSVSSVSNRLEVHTYTSARTTAEVEVKLRKVVEESSEGLVLKNPRSMYRLNERNDDWQKVKPEYMVEFGEALDCVVIGGYFGQGHRGGRLGSFMCGLRVDEAQTERGADPQKCFSFFKVGGGFTAQDYATIRHHTDGKWKDWDPKRPPIKYIELAGGDRQFERPDQWIKPEDSVVISVKAAQIAATDQFRMGQTLRFPRFKKIRMDKNWQQALSIQEWQSLRGSVEKERKEKQFKMDEARKMRPRKVQKKNLVIAGADEGTAAEFEPSTSQVFDGMSFFIMSESLNPRKTSKADMERLVKANGGRIVQSVTAAERLMCIADRNLVKVASVQKAGKVSLIRPKWLFDCIDQAEKDQYVGRSSMPLPLEPQHMFFISSTDEHDFDGNVDVYGDSFAHDVTVDELKRIFQDMPKSEHPTNTKALEKKLKYEDEMLNEAPGWMFRAVAVYFDINRELSNDTVMEENRQHEAAASKIESAKRILLFGGGFLVQSLDQPGITHIVCEGSKQRGTELRKSLARTTALPHVVNSEWILESWKERTLLDEERFIVA